MARIAGVNIPQEKRVQVALTYIFGVGVTTANKILKESKINPDTRVKDLADEDLNKLRAIIEKTIRVEGDLKREIMMNIKRLKDIKSYRGTRHTKNLPCRGQRTKTNSRTKRGNKRVCVGSGRKVSAQKT